MVVCSPPQPMWDITIHPPSRPSVLAGTLSFQQSMWDRPQIHPFFGAQRPYWHTASCLPPFGEQREGRHIVREPGSDTICNDPDPPLADIVLLSNQCGTSQSTPLRGQRPRWHSFLYPIYVGPPPNPPPFGASVLAFLYPIDVGPPPNPPSGPSVLADTRSFIQSMWDRPKSTPLWGPASLLIHRLVSTPPSGNSEKAGTTSGDWL